MTDLFPYQKKGVAKLHHLGGRALLADEMGLGKTIQSLTYLKETYSESTPSIVVCPASLKINWQREAWNHCRIKSEILEGRKPTPREAWKAVNRRDLLIINYDILDGWLEWLRDIGPKLVILDEAQYIKNRNAQRSKNVRELCAEVERVIAISGTPLTSRPAELFNVVNLLRPDQFEHFFPFAQQYCQMKRTRWGWEYKGAENLDDLHQRLNRFCMIRRKKIDVLHQLPKKRRIVVPLELEDREQYVKAETEFVSWLVETKGAAKAMKAAAAASLTRIGYLKRLAAELKMKMALNWVTDLMDEDDGKLILFGVHKKILTQVRKRFPKGSAFIDGSVTGHRRMVEVDRFQKDPQTRLMIANTQAGGVGLNMTAAHRVAMLELPWTPAEVTQGEDRAHRIGQTTDVDIYFLIAEGTVEDDLAYALQRKQEVLDHALDGGKVTDLDIFDMMLEAMRKRQK
jgi:SWI/SNF-related matrix-associated actin-dependent regulator 1 of chromatin subfamily A